jgi:ATP-binding cassette subfamily F protein uup
LLEELKLSWKPYRLRLLTPLFSQPHEQTQQVLANLNEAEQELEQAFERWEYLESLKNGA